MKFINYFLPLLCALITNLTGCVSNRSFSHSEYMEKLSGYFVERYIYRYDSVSLATGYWPAARKIILNDTQLPLANYMSDFYLVFKCKEYLKLEEYVKSIKTVQLGSLIKNASQHYFIDNGTGDLFFVSNVTGNFIYLRRELCSKDKNSLKDRRERKTCTYDTFRISEYPFLIPVTIITADTVSMIDVQKIINIRDLRKTNIDTLNFPICM